MTKDIIARIRRLQSELPLLKGLEPHPHKPEMLLIGCVDARLNPKTDIGIPDGRAIIYRNIAALVGGQSSASERISEVATLEFAINVMNVKHIAVMGHTDCGGIRACLEDNHTHDTQGIRKYLSPLNDVRKDVMEHGGDMTAQARAMEQAAVRQSIENLMSYEVVSEAVKDGRVTLHGWVINTATKHILEMDSKTGQFAAMS